ncbi:hypothetical protein BU14_0532s0002 [Porphyra umbilicalis]|uniref:Protein kinase domain-containing protein n=1 Tax=Porphyra umbilicalis TaxID=2786 RepID=A0A1X6NS50_PORUM|nr:hypothetical protein BU14_0532s0002 [Porphyra umbilicalis]|eukprot:OSX71441.1 hypothetical protein BU14_0532s0002 [Porphyra umbilicalis]
MAPELIRGSPYAYAADVWSLGILAIEAAEWSPPHMAQEPLAAMLTISTSPPPRLRHAGRWSPEFGNFVARCLQADPAARAGVGELAAHPFLRAAYPRAEVAALFRYVRDARAAEAPAVAEGGGGGDVGGSDTLLSAWGGGGGLPGGTRRRAAGGWRGGGGGGKRARGGGVLTKTLVWYRRGGDEPLCRAQPTGRAAAAPSQRGRPWSCQHRTRGETDPAPPRASHGRTFFLGCAPLPAPRPAPVAPVARSAAAAGCGAEPRAQRRGSPPGRGGGGPRPLLAPRATAPGGRRRGAPPRSAASVTATAAAGAGRHAAVCPAPDRPPRPPGGRRRRRRRRSVEVDGGRAAGVVATGGRRPPRQRHPRSTAALCSLSAGYIPGGCPMTDRVPKD